MRVSLIRKHGMQCRRSLNGGRSSWQHMGLTITVMGQSVCHFPRGHFAGNAATYIQGILGNPEEWCSGSVKTTAKMGKLTVEMPMSIIPIWKKVLLRRSISCVGTGRNILPDGKNGKKMALRLKKYGLDR